MFKMNLKFLFKTPSAWIPVLMSAAALTLTLSYLIFVWIPETPPEDEGTAAHLFQLLMGGQIPIIAFFASKYLPEKPKQTIVILIIQFLAGVIAAAPVFMLGL